MKNWKDKVLGIFAGIGIMSLLMGSYSSQPQQITYGTPESHVWGINDGPAQGAFLYNKVTGQIKQLSSNSIDKEGMYITMIEGGKAGKL